ncbi:iron ABC transporter permease [Curvibacter sp. HBC28]|uniref:Iron ABC transporter permease n=1 Tax=Curvibacter microcysteis TaxID=3026419 RepID=A0ABT5MHL7_9BURK|nr:iron ABC transporter permease [Curvibacter sp. HBC28]MDD0815479.1 iron ABC transporter permease [Curvibacter sp. HBC28]
MSTALGAGRHPGLLWGLSSLLLAATGLAALTGAYQLDVLRLGALLWSPEARASADGLVFLHIRLPRLVLGLAAGAGLGLAGALMQGLFRNPLADPGLIGVSSGAALAAASTIVLGTWWWPGLSRSLGGAALVLGAFGGGLLVCALIYGLARSPGGLRVESMLLAGVGVNALAGAGLGTLSFLATDEQLRNLQFWLMGSLGGARWASVTLLVGVVGLAGGLACRLARGLNVLALGEAQAVLSGLRLESLKRQAVALTALLVGAITAFTGVIGFVGLIAPHAVRLLAGSDHRYLLPGSALLGAVLVVGADALARVLVQPAELPLGVLTAYVGVPVFLTLLRRAKRGLG